MQRVLNGLLVALMVAVLPQLLTAEEPKRPDGPNPETLFQRLDANHDGVITPDEIPAGMPEHLKKMLLQADENKDKKLTVGELTKALRHRRPEHQAKDGPRKDGPAKGPMPPHGMMPGGPAAKPGMGPGPMGGMPPHGMGPGNVAFWKAGAAPGPGPAMPPPGMMPGPMPGMMPGSVPPPPVSTAPGPLASITPPGPGTWVVCFWIPQPAQAPAPWAAPPPGMMHGGFPGGPQAGKAPGPWAAPPPGMMHGGFPGGPQAGKAPGPWAAPKPGKCACGCQGMQMWKSHPYWAKMLPPCKWQGKRPGKGPMPKPCAECPLVKMDAKVIFARLDTDKDGKLSFEEFAAGLQKLKEVMAMRAKGVAKPFNHGMARITMGKADTKRTVTVTVVKAKPQPGPSGKTCPLGKKCPGCKGCQMAKAQPPAVKCPIGKEAAKKGHNHHDGKEAAERHKHHDGKKPEAKKPEAKADTGNSIEARVTALERQQAVMFALVKDIRSSLRDLAGKESKETAKAGPKHRGKKPKDQDKDD